ncbi:MAG: hypothetical protein ACLQGP_02035 [Isosphaeraceae bacterium]
MTHTDELLKQPPYPGSPDGNRDLLRAAVSEAVRHHCTSCPPFARWYRKQGADPEAPVEDLSRLPVLPVIVFKRLNLRSVVDGEVVRVLSSSATTAQTPSRVALDAVTRNRQMRSLAVLLSDLMGPARRPFIVFDVDPAVSSVVGTELSARIAGLRGYLMMASRVHHVFNVGAGEAVLDVERLGELLDGYAAARAPVCLIGLTYVFYQQVLTPLLRLGVQFQLPPGSLILHFGGWKRLLDRSVGRERLNTEAARAFVAEDLLIRDVYGFTEQLGVIYPDDGRGVRVAPAWAEVFARDPFTLEVLPDGEPGLLQFITPLPHSYPGFSLLLDDIGRVVSRDREVNGRYGTRFEVLARALGSEVRGCGDTLPDLTLREAN